MYAKNRKDVNYNNNGKLLTYLMKELHLFGCCCSDPAAYLTSLDHAIFFFYALSLTVPYQVHVRRNGTNDFANITSAIVCTILNITMKWTVQAEDKILAGPLEERTKCCPKGGCCMKVTGCGRCWGKFWFNFMYMLEVSNR
eukprot:UN07847